MAIAAVFTPLNIYADISEHRIVGGSKREIVYERKQISSKERLEKEHYQRVVSDSDPRENVKLMMELEPREIWPHSNKIKFKAWQGGNLINISYQNLQGKREMPARNMVYIFSESDLNIKGAQKLIIQNGEEIKYVLAVPGNETREFDKAKVLADYLERVRGHKAAKPTFYDLGKSVILNSRNVRKENPFESLLGEIPGKAGLGLAVAMKATDFLVQRIDGRNRRNIATLGKDYKITQLELFKPRRGNISDGLNQSGRIINLEVEGGFQDPVYIYFPSLNFSGRKNLEHQQSSLKDILFRFSETSQENFQAEKGAHLSQGLRSRAAEAWRLKDEAQSHLVPPRRLVTTLNGRPAAGKPLSLNLGSGVKMEFVWIKRLNCWVGKYEVTNEEYRRFKKDHDSKDYKGHSLNGNRQPVVLVNFDDGKAYAEWLTKQDRASGRLPQGYRYRLPSESEWMTFAQCGDGRKYPWGDNWPPRSGQAGNYDDETTFRKYQVEGGYRDGHNVACDVEESWANKWGLYGVGGNVWEMCAKDSSGSAFGAWRGASWYFYDQDILRCSFRLDGLGSYRLNDYGFRLVLSR